MGRNWQKWSWGVGLSTIVCLAGCQKAAPAPVVPAATPAGSSTPATASSTTSSAEPKPVAPAGGDSSEGTASLKKSLGGVPYDVWFDDPLGVVANSQPVAVAPTTGTPANAAPAMNAAASSAPEPPATSQPSGGSGQKWDELLSMDQVQAEAKEIRNRLTASMQSLAKYNSNYLEIQSDAAVLAGLAHIVSAHPGEVTWKANSPYLEKFSQELNASAAALGRDSYDKTQTQFERITAVLDSNLPADAGELPTNLAAGETASRGGVMKRMEKAFEWMRANLTTEASFKADREKLLQEASLIAALGMLVSDHSYESADEDEYQSYAQSLITGARKAAQAGKDENFEDLRKAVSQIKQSCDNCHKDYFSSN